MDAPSLLLQSAAVSLVICLVGFVRTVWFVSLGYTFSIAGCCVLVAVLAADRIALHSGLQLALLFAWAARLGFFLVKREREAGYREAVRDQTDRSRRLRLAAKVGIWISVSVLYALMFAPAVFATTGSPRGGIPITIVSAGLLVMVTGLVVEAIADQQKSAFKRKNPDRFVNTGLYRFVRCPNYLGEILVWSGSFVVGVPFFAAWWHWLATVVGWVSLVLIMIGSTKRLERKQRERYGEDEAYRTWARKVPVLFPWVPVYSLENVRVYLE
jgi:steroid 5-alpha reductase family enzyme